jgi:outer membrane immunogenic protein
VTAVIPWFGQWIQNAVGRVYGASNILDGGILMRILAAASVLCVLSTSAMAADLGPYPRRGSIKDSIPAEPVYQRSVFSWTGFYIGAQAGYAWADTDASTGPFAGFNETYAYSSEGFVGGGHVGYNWQAHNLVFGIEADFEGSDISDTGVGTLGTPHTTSIDWLGSVRGRLGYAVDRTLFYATAGWAFGDVEVSTPFATFSDTRNGWTVGGGVEHAFTDRLTARVEYRYTDLGSENFSSAALNAIDESDVTFHALRAGVSLKF